MRGVDLAGDDRQLSGNEKQIAGPRDGQIIGDGRGGRRKRQTQRSQPGERRAFSHDRNLSGN
jgi:hypothetical protein